MLKMMNHNATADHKICGSRSIGSAVAGDAVRAGQRRSEGGYTLVALLAMMTVVAMFAMAVAPSLQQQAVREREREAIYRGEQVADAIREYYLYRFRTTRVMGDQSLPTSMDQLLEGIPVQGGAKKRQILRVSATRDPLTIEGEWRFILPRSEGLIDFQQSIMFYSGSLAPQPRQTEIAQLQQFAVPRVDRVTNLGLTAPASRSSAATDDASGPFVGIASRSKRESVMMFYGIERHDQWIFTPLFRP
jgi:type II secretory pathway pseudopilin PulG